MHRLYRLLADGCFHSGSQLGATLGITRAAIWKQIKKLQEEGVEIESVSGKGYRLITPVNFIDADVIKENAPAGYITFVHNQLDSTNLEVKRLLKKGHNSVAVIAEEQSHGRGRRGRKWQSPCATNIYLSLAWPITQGMSQLEGLSLSVGLAVYRTLKKHIKYDLGLKWPNDVLVDRKKISGILIELHGDPADRCYAVIGVGVNINLQQDQLAIDTPWTSTLIETGHVLDRTQITTELLLSINQVLAEHLEHGFEPLRADWERAHLWHNALVKLSFAEREIEGRVLGVTAVGELKLLVEGEERCFAGGELTLRLCDDS